VLKDFSASMLAACSRDGNSIPYIIGLNWDKNLVRNFINDRPHDFPKKFLEAKNAAYFPD
jgi:hypothetical protein